MKIRHALHAIARTLRRHPDEVRMTAAVPSRLSAFPHKNRLGFLISDAPLSQKTLFVDNIDEELVYRISERQMRALLQFLAGDLVETAKPIQSTDLLSWLAAFSESSRSGWCLDRSSRWNFGLMHPSRRGNQRNPNSGSP